MRAFVVLSGNSFAMSTLSPGVEAGQGGGGLGGFVEFGVARRGRIFRRRRLFRSQKFLGVQ
jgi:hypothetical protein